MTPRPPIEPQNAVATTPSDAQDDAPSTPNWDVERTDLTPDAPKGDAVAPPDTPEHGPQTAPVPAPSTTIPIVRRDADAHAPGQTGATPPAFWANHIDPGETIHWFGAPTRQAPPTRKAPTTRAERLRPVLIGMIGVAAGLTLLGSGDERFLIKATGMGVLVLGALMIGRTLTRHKTSRLAAQYLVTDRAIYIASIRGNAPPYVARYALTRTMAVTRDGDSLFFTVGRARGRDQDNAPILVSFQNIPDPESTLDLIHDLQKAMK